MAWASIRSLDQSWCVIGQAAPCKIAPGQGTAEG